jgi:hypothetical protein
MLLPCVVPLRVAAAALDPAATHAVAARADAPALDAARVIAGLKRKAPARTAYTEVQFNSMLDRPLVLHGELAYLGPDKLAKRVEQPYQELTTISDGEVTVERGNRKPRQFSLGRAPELEGFLRGFLALLGGDAAALTSTFDLATDGTPANWQLKLTPHDARLRRHIAGIDVDGDATHPHCFTVRLADGDTNIMLVEQFAQTQLTAASTPATLAAVCRGEAGGNNEVRLP